MSSPSKNSKRFAIGIVVLSAASLALWIAESKFGVLNKLLVGFFGPPNVTLAESYSNDSSTTFDHSVFQELLAAHVDADGWVDYAAIKTNEDRLNAYLESIKEADLEKLGRDERLAVLINSYNAFTIKLIVEHFPVESIKDIASADRWDAVRWNLAGTIVSLSQIEHELIRPNFVEPRIHFALVCAAVGCPPLRNEVYTGANIEQQLTQQTSYVHNHATWLQKDSVAKTIRLTQLYNWYGDDFVQTSGSVLDFVRKNSTQLADDESPTISWLDYDWALNDVNSRAAR